MMMALAARQMRVSMDSRRAREAARAINVYISSARNQAIATRKYCGVALMPMMNIAASTTATTTVAPCVATLQQLEVPAPYAGDYANATLNVQSVGGGWLNATIPAGASPISPGLVHIGDRMQFNNQGPWVTVGTTGVNGVPPYSLYTSGSTVGQVSPWNSPTAATFCIQRMPNLSNVSGSTVAAALIASDVAPLQLPAGAVIDLSGSWFGDATNTAVYSINGSPAFPSGTIVDPNNPPPLDTSQYTPPVYVGLYIMFSPSGAVDSLYCAFYATTTTGVLTCYASQSLPISRSIYLLVGRPDYARNLGQQTTLNAQGGGTRTATMQNWLDPSNIWVVINPQTGVVTTAPVLAIDPSYTDAGGTAQHDHRLEQDRRATAGDVDHVLVRDCGRFSGVRTGPGPGRQVR